jgi:regulator of replication initiation timing
MTLNPLKWIEWVINEHGSSTVLRERLAQAKDRMADLERENAALKQERDDLRARLEKADVQIDDLKKQNELLHKALAQSSSDPGGGSWG